MEAEPVAAGAGARQAAPVGTEPLDITVLSGGPGSEREVSLASGQAVAEALRRCGHRVCVADVAPDDTSAIGRAGVDVVFIALHGVFGEDGQVQRLCEDRQVPYVGTGPDASRLGMDKSASKQAFRRAGLATPDWVVLDGEAPCGRHSGLLAQVPPPCVVKPVAGGSSVDISIVRDLAARDEAVDAVVARYGRAMVEAFIPGRELTVGVLGEQALPVVEIRTARGFYDYRAKYVDDDTQYIAPAELTAAVAEHVQSAGLAAHRAIGCRGFSRTDFILAEDGTAQVLEINTIPGFTSHSLLPKAAAAAGISFEQLCDRIVRLALRRSRR